MTVRINDGELVWREVDEQIVLLDLKASTYFQLNRSGTLLWRRLVEGATKEILVAALVEVYDIPSAQALAEVESFLGVLESKGMVQR